MSGKPPQLVQFLLALSSAALHLYGDEVVVQAAGFIGLQHQAALLVHRRLGGHVGDPGHVAQTAVVIGTQPRQVQVWSA